MNEDTRVLDLLIRNAERADAFEAQLRVALGGRTASEIKEIFGKHSIEAVGFSGEKLSDADSKIAHYTYGL